MSAEYLEERRGLMFGGLVTAAWYLSGCSGLSQSPETPTPTPTLTPTKVPRMNIEDIGPFDLYYYVVPESAYFIETNWRPNNSPRLRSLHYKGPPGDMGGLQLLTQAMWETYNSSPDFARRQKEIIDDKSPSISAGKCAELVHVEGVCQQPQIAPGENYRGLTVTYNAKVDLLIAQMCPLKFKEAGKDAFRKLAETPKAQRRPLVAKMKEAPNGLWYRLCIGVGRKPDTQNRWHILALDENGEYIEPLVDDIDTVFKLVDGKEDRIEAFEIGLKEPLVKAMIQRLVYGDNPPASPYLAIG